MRRENAATPPEASSDKAHINLALEVGLLTVLCLIWGSSFTLMKAAVETIPPLTMTSARVGIAALLLVLIAKMLGLTLPRERPIWAALFVQGLLQSALPFTLISWGEKHIASGLAGVLNATPPIFVLLMAWATGHEGKRITAPTNRWNGTRIGRRACHHRCGIAAGLRHDRAAGAGRRACCEPLLCIGIDVGTALQCASSSGYGGGSDELRRFGAVADGSDH